MPVFAREREFDSLIYAEAARRGLDPLLIKAVIATESSFNPQAIRPEPQIKDASRGLMQILAGTAKMMGYTGAPEGLFDPATNIRFGSAYLAHQVERYGGSIPSAVAAYNAGTAKTTERGHFTNQEYVNRVLGYYEEFKQREAPRPSEPPPAPPVGPGAQTAGLLAVLGLLGLLAYRLWR